MLWSCIYHLGTSACGVLFDGAEQKFDAHMQHLALNMNSPRPTTVNTMVTDPVLRSHRYHQYKFIVDGKWRHDETAPFMPDPLGNVNNW